MIRNSFVAVLMFVSSFSFAQDDTPKATWVTSPITIDGKPLEWKLPLRFYDNGTKLFFAFANDDKNLYLCFQAPDDMYQTKIMHAGMEVALGAKGKHKISVSFPLPQQATPVSTDDDNNAQQTADRKNRRTSFILQNTLMETDGFASRNGMIPINDTSGINAAINWDESNKLTYEMAIPFKEWFGADYNIADLPKDVSLDITINALKQPRNNNGGRNFAGGGHHDHNANSDGENHVLPGEYKYNLYEKRRLRQKFILAQSSDAD